MQPVEALTFAVDIYALTLIVAIFVGIVIIGIRRITADSTDLVRTASHRPGMEDLEQ